jgi:hypothetical protein
MLEELNAMFGDCDEDDEETRLRGRRSSLMNDVQSIKATSMVNKFLMYEESLPSSTPKERSVKAATLRIKSKAFIEELLASNKFVAGIVDGDPERNKAAWTSVSILQRNIVSLC